jgi:hypothetical protein
MIKAFFFLACAVLAFGVRASAAEIGATIIPAAGEPVTLTHCSSYVDPNAIVRLGYNNRADVFLTSYVVRLTLFDHSNVAMGFNDFDNSFTSDLAPSDATTYADFWRYPTTEPLSALDHITCRMQSAKFEGGLSWTYGRPWHRPLSKLP